MAKRKKVETGDERFWNYRPAKGNPRFLPVLATSDLDRSHVLSPRAAFKCVQVVEFANLSYMFGGFGKALTLGGLSVEELVPGEAVLFINAKRNYIKLLMGNGTPSPVIAAYRFPKGMRLPSQATEAVVRSFLKRGEVQMDERLRLAVGETVSEMRERVKPKKI